MVVRTRYDGWIEVLTRRTRNTRQKTRVKLVPGELQNGFVWDGWNATFSCSPPLGIRLHHFNFGEGPAFAFALLALCPLAERFGTSQRKFQIDTSKTIGGLLNATFGNDDGDDCLKKVSRETRLLRVVQLSLVGSIFSNMP